MTKHSRQWFRPALMCMVALFVSPAMAQSFDNLDDLDVTMRMVVDDEELTNSVVREIELPEPMIRGQEIRQGASGMPGQGRPERPDLDTALDAMERGQEIGESASERASEAREIIDSERPGRDGLLDSLPGRNGLTDLPGKHDLLNDTEQLLDDVGDKLDPDNKLEL
ncbi:MULTISPECIES: hypothetical protein [Marinobacter]|jgi:hypothetical protein|uniref:hypothetical protein n=1 Tax=Marinobacter TaxID=2742 RepID=UPI002004D08D|nr:MULTISPECIES: hypothetical protein [Marinobacter]MCK7553096.1 hypothetical protein [Marinobacter goseongensis]MDV3504048.1 hypothetical protein [Marinobacter sp. M-5]